MRSLGLFLFIQAAAGWSSEGHKIVSRIALGLMKKKTRRFLREHLEDIGLRKAVSLASSWADVISEDRPETSSYHFVNVEYRNCSKPLDAKSPCGDSGGPCIVTAIANFANIAANISSTFIERQEAIKFLLHLVADAHQPLHAGFERDRGGTLIDLEKPEGMSLHEVWDSTLVSSLKEFETTEWFDVAREWETSEDIRGAAEHQVPGNFLEASIFILSETIRDHTCASAYQNENSDWIEAGDALSREYLGLRSQVVKTQLLKSAGRLAQIMDAVANRFVVAERRIYDAFTISAPKMTGSTNSFSGLDFDLDVDDFEEMVFELDEIADDDGETAPVSIDEPSAMPTVTSTISPEEKRRKANRARKLAAKTSRRKINGIDVDSLVLIKRKSRFFITAEKRVVSENFRPEKFFVIDIHFKGMEARDSGIPFFFDTAVFSTERLPDRTLIDAIFNKLAAHEPGTTNAPIEAVESFAIQGVPQNRPLMKTVMAFDQKHPAIEIAKEYTDLESASLGAIADLVPRKVSNKIVREKYGGDLPSSGQLALDALKAKSASIVKITTIPGIVLVSTKEALMDRSQIRWVFVQEFGTNIAAAVLKTTRLLVDIRVVEGYKWDDRFWPEIERIISKVNHSQNFRQIVKRGSPFLDRLKVFYAPIALNRAADFPGFLKATALKNASFAKARSIAGGSYMEYLLRPSAEEQHILNKWKAPGIPAFVPPGSISVTRSLD
jgi:hypothetical protein